MSDFKPGDRVYAGNTLAEFVGYTSNANPASAIIKVGFDTRVVAAVTLRKAS